MMSLVIGAVANAVANTPPPPAVAPSCEGESWQMVAMTVAALAFMAFVLWVTLREGRR